MPCGGIYPVRETHDATCFQCGQVVRYGSSAYAVEEWDAIVHPECIPAFMKTPEGEIVISHEHEILLRAVDFSLISR